MQKNIRELLKDNGTSWQSLILGMVEDAHNIVMQNNNGDVLPDYKSRAKAKKDILEAAGIFKPAGQTSFNFFTQIFDSSKSKPRENVPQEDVIEGF